MAEAKFVLKEPNSKSSTLVYLIFRFDSQRLKYSTGEKIMPKYWNAKKQQANAQLSGYAEFNTRLKKIASLVEEGFRRLRNDGIQPTPERLKEALNEKLEIIPEAKQVSFIGFCESFIEEVSAERRKGSLQVYRATVKHLKAFATEKKYKVDFDTITLTFYNEFVAYLTEKGMVTNTVGKYIKTIKSFMNEATERGLNKNLEFKSKKFKRVQEDIDHVYLTQEELDIIEGLDLTQNKPLEKVRDMFLMGCYTGLRFSDFTQINKENFVRIEKKDFIKIRTVKTNEDVVIPMSKVVRKILAKYDGELPKMISNQKMNSYLKEVCEKAEIDTSVEIKRTSGNKIIKQQAPKFQLVSTHTARRSFATNAYKATRDTLAIMKITGHRTEKAFMKYIKISKEENAIRLSENEFFK